MAANSSQRDRLDSDRPTRGRDAAATKERLLDAAEALFAERGFEGTSMRAVTQAAGVSVSAANYHFGSKEALLKATLGRVIEPVNRVRLERLDRLEHLASRDGALALEAVLDAFLRPAIEARAAGDAEPSRLRHVAARLYSDPPELVLALKREYFEELALRFIDALGRALPGRDRGELEIAFEFTVAMMVHVIAGQLASGPLSSEHDFDRPEGREALLEQMIRYAAAGLRAVPVKAENHMSGDMAGGQSVQGGRQ